MLNMYVFFFLFMLTLIAESKFLNTLVCVLAPYYLLFWAYFTLAIEYIYNNYNTPAEN